MKACPSFSRMPYLPVLPGDGAQGRGLSILCPSDSIFILLIQWFSAVVPTGQLLPRVVVVQDTCTTSVGGCLRTEVTRQFPGHLPASAPPSVDDFGATERAEVCADLRGR